MAHVEFSATSLLFGAWCTSTAPYHQGMWTSGIERQGPKVWTRRYGGLRRRLGIWCCGHDWQANLIELLRHKSIAWCMSHIRAFATYAGWTHIGDNYQTHHWIPKFQHNMFFLLVFLMQVHNPLQFSAKLATNLKVRLSAEPTRRVCLWMALLLLAWNECQSCIP